MLDGTPTSKQNITCCYYFVSLNKSALAVTTSKHTNSILHTLFSH
ncbi:hypothetical protein C359_01502 [Cryptococcus neoformans Bt120]|nr:hypothetical protein C359_01502 [Cryptococcus neoformans var. grubii Bt120]